jgi:hypothetical protein
MRSDPCLDQDAIELELTTLKKEGPQTSEAFFFAEHPVPSELRSSFRARLALIPA